MTAAIVFSALEMAVMLASSYVPALAKRHLLLKVLCSFLFVMAAYSAYRVCDCSPLFPALMLAGHLCGMLGDFFLELKKTFALGSGCFAAGHICYTVAFDLCFDKSLWSFPLFPILYCLSCAAYFVLIIKADIRFGGKRFPVALYCLSLLAMACGAVSRAVLCIMQGKVLFAALIAAGALLFVYSDTVLFLSMLSPKRIKHSSNAIKFSYFPAQTLLGLAILFV